MNDGNLAGVTKFGFAARATACVEQERTGSRVSANSVHARVQAWAMSPVHDRNEAEREFVNSLSNVRRLEPSELICFRGRRDFTSGCIPQPNDMGPSPVARAGRYNRQGKSVLYLCETEKGIMREPIGGTGALWLQRFLLPTSDLTIADLRPGRADEFVDQVFWFAEHAGEAPNHCSLEFSQHVAELVAERFDAMMVPGVRGDKSYKYSNIVVLRQVSEWMSWLHPESLPSICE